MEPSEQYNHSEVLKNQRSPHEVNSYRNTFQMAGNEQIQGS